MTTTIIKAFEVLRWDGGEFHRHHCYIADEVEASKLAGPHDLVKPVRFIIHDTADDAISYHQGKIREQAIAKLTDVERAALGIS
jgi:hypothetical protein